MTGNLHHVPAGAVLTKPLYIVTQATSFREHNPFDVCTRVLGVFSTREAAEQEALNEWEMRFMDVFENPGFYLERMKTIDDVHALEFHHPNNVFGLDDVEEYRRLIEDNDNAGLCKFFARRRYALDTCVVNDGISFEVVIQEVVAVDDPDAIGEPNDFGALS